MNQWNGFWGTLSTILKFIYDFQNNLKIGLNSVGQMYIVSALLSNAHTILSWSPQPSNSILFRIPLGAHFSTNPYNIFWLKPKRVFNHMNSKCKKREGDVDYTGSS